MKLLAVLSDLGSECVLQKRALHRPCVAQRLDRGHIFVVGMDFAFGSDAACGVRATYHNVAGSRPSA